MFRRLARSLLELAPSDKLYVFLFRVIVLLARRRLRIHYESPCVVLDGRHAIPNPRRLPLYVNGLAARAARLGEEYLVYHLRFSDGDVVVDCGANAGDFMLTLDRLTADVEYFAFEPGPLEYECLSRNATNFQRFRPKLFNKALSDSTNMKTLYMNSSAGDNSLEQFKNVEQQGSCESIRLDSFFEGDRRIKLFKVEAEGHEPEVLRGASGLLSQIENIVVDVGFERGMSNDSTLPSVVNFLLERNFIVRSVGRDRMVLLFENQEFS